MMWWLPVLFLLLATSCNSWTLSRRSLIGGCCVLLPVAQADAAERAVGSGEQACRINNNCLEKGELDGAIGWEWGGKDRCDALEPTCGPDGRLRETIIGQPVPAVPEGVRIRQVAAVQIEIGRQELGVLKLALYDEADQAVKQLVEVLSKQGLKTSVRSKAINIEQDGVSLVRGGAVTTIVPGMEVELGVPSQANAYSRSRGRSKTSDDFCPQQRPIPFTNEAFLRPHDCAGLISVPAKGVGYGGTGFESEDEAFESSFLITACALPVFDEKKTRRRVVGQVLDGESMAFLERLANLPTKRGIRGVLPGQTSGPPLPKVLVREVQLSSVN